MLKQNYMLEAASFPAMGTRLYLFKIAYRG